MQLNSRSLLIAAAIAGVGMAVLSAIPIISLVNCLLCGWVWGGAIFAVWLYKRYENGAPVTPGQGVVIGLVAALIGAVINWLLAALMGGASAAALGPALDQLPDAESRQMLRDLVASGGFSILGLLFSLVIYSIFGVVGGLIGSAIFGNRPVSPPPTVPPSLPPTA